MNAREARKATDKKIIDLMEAAEIEDVLLKIKESINQGKYSVTYNGLLSVGQVRKLQSIGYNINTICNSRHLIKWQEEVMW